MKRVVALLVKKQKSVGAAAFVLALMVLTSRLLGLIRDRLLAARFAPDELGVYFAAFRLPNLLFELLVMGALTSAFIPVVTKYLTQKKENDAWSMVSTLINVSLLILILIALPFFIWAREFSKMFAPGFSDGQIEQMVTYTRFMIAFQVTPLLIGNLFTGLLQAYQLFLVPALAPVIYNLGIIAGILLLTPALGLMAPVVGVAIGAVLFMVIQIPLIFSVGYRYRFEMYYRHPGVREVGKLMLPRTIGLAIGQIDTTVDLILASLLGARMVTIFNFAQHLQQLPIGLFGTTIAQAALPTLSISEALEDRQQFQHVILRSLHQILFFILPLSVFFIVLRIPIVRLVFGASRFDWSATVLTGMTLAMFSISLFAQAVSQVLARGFYALYDSKTPVIVGVVSILVNTILSIYFIRVLHLSVWSLGLSTSVASILNSFVLFIILDKRLGYFPRAKLIVSPIKMLVAALVTAITLYIPMKLFDQLVFDTTRTLGLLLLTGTAGLVGLFTYSFLSWVFGVGEIRSFIALLRKVSKSSTVLLEPASEVIDGGGQDKLT
ncbi:murein biosynthesis integral membrane protein MurJ [Candidatus Gottesmanbacteria bacterium]|nr:murein biosynthesis integral membrane protein MurJ [Candidatus Gottesmanbacteria bacterium]